MSKPFRWRGGQVTRLEALTDAVFGFAITLLFVSFDVPTTFDGLLLQLRGFVSFAPSFALILLVWMYHYRLFERYDLEDTYTIVLNSVLLFVVLFYVYPLKLIGVGVVALVLAYAVPPQWSPMISGFSYRVIGPLQWAHARRLHSRKEQLLAAARREIAR